MNRYSIVAVAAFVLAGCNGSKDANKSNFQAAIQAYLDTTTGACVPLPDKEMPFKIEQADGFGKDRRLRADALVEAGLLTRKGAEVPQFPGSNRLVPGFEYALTEAGRKQLVKGAGGNLANWDGFCAGKYKVVSIANFTDPANLFGSQVSQVNYRYKIEAPAKWAALPAIQAAFPKLARDMKDDAADKAVLVLTNDGWVHERLFKAASH